MSDPAGAGRGDKKRAKALIDAAYASGRITAADRALRFDRVDAAATRGDLAGLTAGLEAPVTPPSQVAQQPYQPPQPSPHPSWPQQPAAGAPGPVSAPRTSGAQTPGMPTTSWQGPQGRPGIKAPRGRLGCVLGVIGIAVLLPCFAGVFGIVTSVFTGVVGFSSGSGDLDTRSAWSSIVDDVREQNGTTRVERVRFYDAVATVWVRTPTGEAKETRWLNGTVQSTSTRTTSFDSPVSPTFDLAPLTDVLARVRDRAVQRLGVTDPRTVQTDVLPTGITVTVIGTDGSFQTARYDLTGNAT
ncbi:DUF1707 SHOCT-like domain-containing protein [Aeromicrobium sp. Root495]|uniref:DUF1707 SHOCT-like domain-containing protein n=1 Tax=Aeromicrobium sp. Root495 TaxID=1736550 RepID=UPI000ADF8A1F|nr:DUF1707 domain-containing protein [Aeromicrobium sp. Root495]